MQIGPETEEEGGKEQPGISCGRISPAPGVLPEKGSVPALVVICRCGGRIASGSGDRTIRVWDAATGGVLMTLNGHSGGVLSVCFFPDGNQLVSGSSDETAHIWDLESGTCVTELKGHSDDVWSVAVSPDGSRTVSGSSDNTVQIWDVPNGTSLKTLQGHTSEVLSVSFSPSGDRIVSGSHDLSVRLWNATTGDHIATFRGHTYTVRSVVFSPDGRRVVSGSDDATVKIWDANALAETESQDGTSHSDEVRSLAFSSAGSRLVSLDWGDIVHVWDLAAGRSILSFSIGEELYKGWTVHFSSDNTRIILVPEDTDEKLPIAFEASSGNRIEEEGVQDVDEDTHMDDTEGEGGNSDDKEGEEDCDDTEDGEEDDDEEEEYDPCYQKEGPFRVAGGTLLRKDVSPPITICFLPPSYAVPVTAIVSTKLDGTPGNHIAIGFKDGRVLVLDVAP